MIKSVLLLYPPLDDEYFTGGVNDCPPLGLVVLQNYIQRYLKWDVNIDVIDGEYFSLEEVLQMVSSGKYQMIASQTMMASYKNTLVIMEKAKERNLITILGGHHATQLKDEIMKKRHDIIDFIIAGDGEEAFAGLVLEEEKDKIPNLVYYDQSAGIIKHTFEKNVPLEYGVVDYVDPKILQQYYRDIGRKLEREEPLVSFRVYSHKGCSNRTNSQYCFFCGRADKGVRFKKPEDYVREVGYVASLPNTKYIFEIGDDFLQDLDWLKAIVELLKDNPIPSHVHMKIFARANRITEEVVEILKQLNIDEVAIGFESGSDRILKNISKNATTEDNIKAATLLYKNGIDTVASFVLGLPGEDEESLISTYETAKRIQQLALKYLGRLPQEIIANIIEINPGAPAFRKLKKAMPEKYKDEDLLDVYETQNDYFKMQFDLATDEEVKSFRKNLVKWGNLINGLGKYTYPAGFQKEEVRGGGK